MFRTRHQHDGTPWNTAAYLLEQAQVSAIGQAEVQQGDINGRGRVADRVEVSHAGKFPASPLRSTSDQRARAIAVPDPTTAGTAIAQVDGTMDAHARTHDVTALLTRST